VFYTRRPDVLRRAFSLVPDYLATADDPRAVNLMDYGVRSAAASARSSSGSSCVPTGVEGIAAMIREQVRIVQALAAKIDCSSR